MRPLPLAAYAFLSYPFKPIFHFMLSRRLKVGKEDLSRIHERYGKSFLSWQDHPVIWVHASSVGESLSALALIHALSKQYPHFRFVVTTNSKTSAQIMSDSLPITAIHQYFPLDYPKWVKHFLESWDPKAILFIESEFWPNFLHIIKKRQIPTFLINGRISDQSFKHWSHIPHSIQYLLSTFSICFGQSLLDKNRLEQLGAKQSYYLGNLKFISQKDHILEPPVFPTHYNKWLFASTHEGEEEMALDIHQKLQEHIPDICTCIMPRHAERSDQIEKMLIQKGCKVSRKSRNETPQNIYLFDVMGHADEFYALGGPTLMGRSFHKGGGQNPIEPAKAGNIILLGPDMSNFKHISSLMIEAAIAEQISNPDILFERLFYWLSHPKQAQKKSLQTYQWSRHLGDGILENYIKHLSADLDKI